MAINLLNDWSSIKIQDSADEGGTTYGESLTGGKLGTLKFAAGGALANTTIDAGQTVNLAIYQAKGSGGLYLFGSTNAVDTSNLTKGDFTLVGYGTAMPADTIGSSSIEAVNMNTIAFTLTNSNQVLNFANASIAAINGSSGNDSIIISDKLASGANLTSLSLDFSQGGEDKIYIATTEKNWIDTLKGTSGKLSLVASTGDASGNVGVVLGADLSGTTITGTADGTALTFALAESGTANFTAASGKITLTGSTINSLTLGEMSIGTFTATATSGIVALNAGTLSGGTQSFKITDAGTAKFTLINGGAVEVSGTTTNVTADSVTKGTLKISGTSGNTVTTAITESGKFAYGNLTLAAGTVLKSAVFTGTTMQGAAQTLAGGSIKAGGAFTFAGTSADVISINDVAANANVVVKNITASDTLSVGAVGAGAHVTLADSDAATNYIKLGEGSSFENAVVSAGTNAEVFKGSDKAVTLKIEDVGNASIVGSNLADRFDFASIASGSIVTIAGGSGNDVYNFATGLGGTVSITDFGWSNSAESAADTSKGEDILLVSSTGAQTLGAIKLTGNGTTVEFGSSKVVAKLDSAVSEAYVKIGTTVENAQTYKVNSEGAGLVGSDGPNKVDPDTTAGGKVFDASSREHAYIDAGSGASTVKSFTTYTGTNERTASILNPEPMTLDNVKSSTDANGNVTLTDGTNTILMEGLGSDKMIKMGDSVSPAAVVLVGTGTDTVTEAVENVASRYIGDTLGTSMLDFTNTDKKVIDLSGENSDDTVTYQNIAKVTGSDDGKSLLVSGSTGVSLQSAGAGDTLSGAGKGNDMLISNSKEATTFLLQSGGGSDSISGFLSGKDTLAIDTSMPYDGSLFKASSGAVVVGDSGSSYSIVSNSASGAVVNYVYGEGEDAPYGKALVDVSASGGNIAYADGVNLVFGQGAKSTLSVASGDTVSPDKGREAEPSGIGWNSMILTTDVGTIDGTDSKMTAFNGQGGYSQTVKSSTVVGAGTPVWLCGGLQADYADAGNDTLVASGNGNNVVWVGAKMGNDVIQGLTSGDTIGFLATKIGDYASAADAISDIVKVTEKGFTATFSGGNTITGAFASTSDKITNLVFHFDQTEEGVANDYRWDGKGLVAITSTQTA